MQTNVLKTFLIILSLTAVMTATAQNKLYITVGSRTISASLVDNEASRCLLQLLSEAPMTISMTDYGGFEKVGTLPQLLPASDTRITTVPGDIMLYQGRNMVIFYGANTWSYTPLGRIDSATAVALKEFLGNGNVEVTLSVTPVSGIDEVEADSHNGTVIYDLKGNLLREVCNSGLYIINGKKTFIKK